MKDFIVVVLFIILIIIVFILGARWEAFRIKTELEEKGIVTIRIGDHTYAEISGKIKKVEKQAQSEQ